MTHRKHNPALAGIAIFKLSKCALVATVGFGAIGWIGSGLSGEAAELMGVLSFTSERRAVVGVLEAISGLSEGKLRAIGIIAFCYALLFLIEGIGLWYEKRWAEYLTAIATASFIPVEVYEVWHRFSPARLSALVINLLVLAFLVWIIRKNSPRRHVEPILVPVDPS